VYGLETLAPGIQSSNKNKTRFYVLSLKEPADELAQRLAFIATGKADNLPALMSEMKKKKMTLIAIHDRPRKTELGE
jgi:prephenate dehydratase